MADDVANIVQENAGDALQERRPEGSARSHIGGTGI